MDPSSQHTITEAPAALSTEPAAYPTAPAAYSLDPATYPTDPAAYPADAAAYSSNPAAYPTAPAPPYVHNPYADQHNANFPQKQMQIQKQMQMRMQKQMPIASGGDYHPGHSGRTGLVDAEVIQGDEAAIPQGIQLYMETSMSAIL